MPAVNIPALPPLLARPAALPPLTPRCPAAALPPPPLPDRPAAALPPPFDANATYDGPPPGRHRLIAEIFEGGMVCGRVTTIEPWEEVEGTLRLAGLKESDLLHSTWRKLHSAEDWVTAGNAPADYPTAPELLQATEVLAKLGDALTRRGY